MVKTFLLQFYKIHDSSLVVTYFIPQNTFSPLISVEYPLVHMKEKYVSNVFFSFPDLYKNLI